MKLSLVLCLVVIAMAIGDQNDDDLERYVRTYCYVVKTSDPFVYETHNLAQTCLYNVQVFGSKVIVQC